MIEIRNFAGDILITIDADHLRGADLRWANLIEADLTMAKLTRA